MPDISMCASIACPMKDSCYRYMAVPNVRFQSYISPEPWSEQSPCPYLSPILKGDQLRSLEVDAKEK